MLPFYASLAPLLISPEKGVCINRNRTTSSDGKFGVHSCGFKVKVKYNFSQTFEEFYASKYE